MPPPARTVVLPLLNGDQTIPPRGAKSEAADVRLDFLTQADAESQILPRAEIVLNVPAELDLRQVDERIADALREGRGAPAS